MTTYVLPTTSEIGTVKYFEGDLVWFDGKDWMPIVLGTQALNKLITEVLTDEHIANVVGTELFTELTNLKSALAALPNKAP